MVCSDAPRSISAAAFGVKICFFDQKLRKSGMSLQNSRDPSVGRNFACPTPECVLNKTCDAIANEKIYL